MTRKGIHNNMTLENLANNLVTRELVLENALKYCKFGFSVIPVGRDKRPKISWEEFIERCATEEEIKNWWEKYPYANIGLVTGVISGFCVVDADGSIGQKSVEPYIPANTIRCHTPNGGMHYYFSVPDSQIANATRFIPGVDFRGNGGYVVAPPSVGSNGNCYDWVLGSSIYELDLTQMPQELLDMLNTTRLKPINVQQNTDDMFSDGRRDTDLFTTANALFKSGMNYSQVEQVITRLAATCNPPFSQQEAVTKVQSAMKRAIVRERNLLQEVNDYIAGTVGVFSMTELHTFLNITNKTEKFKVARIMRELSDKKFIERASTSRNGTYRRVIKEEDQIDFVHAPTDLVDLKWPFHLEKYVQLMPKNIAVIAGTPNSGKTAFCLNMIHMNQTKFDMYYFSSEMGSTEFKARLSKFNMPLDRWKFTAIERSEEFQDVVRPDAINIIDFLEIHDEFFKMGGYLKHIFDKLTTGVAIIALQRNPKNDTGLGGYRSLEKPRLYLNMSSDTLEIVKAKNWQQEGINPNGLRINFTIEKGWKFKSSDGWYRMQ
jgi:hypothetical protein